MSASVAIPRVDSQQLKNFVGQKVTLVGRVEAVSGTVVQLSTPDGGRVTVQGRSVFDAPVVEVQGVVQDPSTIHEDEHVQFQDNFGEDWGWLDHRLGNQ